MKYSYQDFITSRKQMNCQNGFDPIWIPQQAFDFQSILIEWAIRKGRSAIFADCGLGKTLMQLAWAENVVRHTNKPVLLATPIAVGSQTLLEADKFGITARRTRNGDITSEACVWVTNYEQLHKYDPMHFSGFVGDESGCIKDMKSARKFTVTEFTRRIPYRLLCTATAAPNDFFELGNSSEVLGYLGFRDMITWFFKQETSKDHHGWGRTKYRFRGHAEQPFWSWVCSWARSICKPSDLGCSDKGFILPELVENEIVVQTSKARPGQLFSVPARDMREERAERRHSIQERCEYAASIALENDRPISLWCELNPEGDLLEKLIPESRQVSGSMSDEEKEEVLTAFSTGQLKRIVLKPKLGAWGMNWQHCSDAVVFPSHSYEQYYQLVRRHYRFGQMRPVNVSLIITEGESGIAKNLKRKQLQSQKMFQSIVRHMSDAMSLVSEDVFPMTTGVPSWV